jgi:Zn-dependent protease
MDADLAYKIQQLLIGAVPIVMAITFHEAAHGFVADRKGDATARLLGRLTLNPLVHIDPIGTILVPVMLYVTTGFVFGWAKPVPVNFVNLRRPKADMVWVAAAGPLMNLVLAVVCGIFLKLLHGAGVGAVSGEAAFSVVGPLQAMLKFGVTINVLLMVFNLLPLPPLDGGRVLVGLLPHPASEKVAALERFGFPILLLLMLEPTHSLMRVVGAFSTVIIRFILS